MYKLLALDIDGTLLNSKDKITDKTKEYIKKASSKGVKVVICSGRPPCDIYDIAKEIELEKIGGYILALNGGTCIDYKNKKQVYEVTFSKDTAIDIYEFSKEKNIPLITFHNEFVYTPSEITEHLEYAKNRYNFKMCKMKNFADELDFNIPKIIFLEEEEILKNIEKEAKERFPDVSIFRSEKYMLELCPKDVHKATGLEKLLEILDVKREELIAIGDGYNDLTMIEFAGLGVAMGNGRETLKEVANYITKENDEDGVAHVIEKFILEEL